MTFALCLSYINARHFRSKPDLWGNFVPGFIFFQSIFGYLAIIIVYKWSVDWEVRGTPPPSVRTFINLPLKFLVILTNL